MSFKKCGWEGCTNLFEPEQTIVISLFGQRLAVKTGNICHFCFKKWADKSARLCDKCRRPIIVGQAVARQDSAIIHFSCGAAQEEFLGYFWADGSIQLSPPTTKKMEVSFI